ncbi:MAG: pseudouridine synthase [Eubacteriales bacterium]
MRLDKYLREMNLGTRSEVKELIKKGQVTVNGQVVKKPEIAIIPNVDQVFYQGNLIEYEKYLYYLLHKPQGVVSATKDNVYPTVLDLLEVPRQEELFPVGRLDVDTEGLLLLTNDGELAHALLSPKKHVSKVYLATIDGILGEREIKLFARGMDLDDFITKPAKLLVKEYQEKNTLVEVTIEEGKFHQIKRMFHYVGRNVLTLKRIKMGLLELPEELPCGAYIKLTKEEVVQGIVKK